MNVNELLDQLRHTFHNERDKGTAFEELICNYFKYDPVYASQISDVWMWKDFPYRDAISDIGIDLVAQTKDDEFWAIQCKFYEENTTVSKSDVDSFLSASSKKFYYNDLLNSFSARIIVSTSSKYGKNAEAVLENQNPPVTRIGMQDLVDSSIDWSQFFESKKIVLKEKYTPRPHQEEAIADVIEGFKIHDRGKLIMACGTGKTFTSLRLVEKLLKSKGNVLFFVPSIALVNQTLSEWSAQAQESFNAVVVCSDNKVGKGDDLLELKIPSTTNLESLKKWVKYTKNNESDMNFVFSTYQSIEMVHKMQEETNIHFDIIVCDEAHRTTGVTLANEDESNFKRVHDNTYIKADKRLYMTATPRIFGDAVKGKAKEIDATLASMDDESIYGPEFHNLTFSESVKQGLLTDYKVLILAIDEEYVKKELQGLLTDGNHEISLDDSVKIMGCWKGLSKETLGNKNDSFETDPLPMKRAVAFCNQIKDSKALVESFEAIQDYIDENDEDESKSLVKIELQHVDGTFNALEKKNCISWLKDSTDDNTCRILTNARCLSEGVDVPALDSVIFLNPRSSMVDIIQSVGRVMRKAKDKKYGYVLLPVGISADEDPADALDNNKKYQIIWSVLQALRAHDDRFNNTINKIDLNKHKPKQIGIVGIGQNKKEDADDGQSSKNDLKKPSFYQGTLNFDTLDQWRDSIYAKMVKKVGSRRYWESWAKDVAEIAQRHMDRIRMLLDKHDPKIDTVFHDFVYGLQTNLNGSITEDDAIEMLAQHLITKPVFDALFEQYEFVKNNPVSQTMQGMMDILDEQALDEEKTKLNKFYESVKERAQGIDNSAGKQKIILELYEKFFKTALPKEVEKLGIVYTPTECVDFIIHSVESILNKEFGMSLSDKGVHIIDGFTGTGTFIVQLLKSGIIKKEDLLYKYTNEIHANEIVLLAYYIAAINIEETFHELYGMNKYVPFEGIVLTDTFQLYEDWKDDEFTQAINEEILPRNSERAKLQRELPITVCIGNPPYSIGQKSQDDNAQNMKYEKLDNAIANSYVKYSNSKTNRALYDGYIRAYRWATDRIKEKGVIAFISNASFIDSANGAGFRKCLIDEFTSIYVFNLRGNARTSGEQRKKEKDNVFGQGTRTSVAITILVKNPNRTKDNYINYYDIGDYLTREEKLSIVKEFGSVDSINWKHVAPDENNDWINKRNNNYKNFYPTIDKDKKTSTIFDHNSNGLFTSRDRYIYGFSKEKVRSQVERMIEFYNSEIERYKRQETEVNLKEFITYDETIISWSRALINSIKRKETKTYSEKNVVLSVYRPFCKQFVYYSSDFNECQYQTSHLFKGENLGICIHGLNGKKEFSVLMVDHLPDLNILDAGAKCLPLYWYEENDDTDTLFVSLDRSLIRKDGISSKFLEKVRNFYKNTDVEKEDIFYYVYSFLHSKEYRTTFKADLNKEFPRIYLVRSFSEFKEFVEKGKLLANLHLNYELSGPSQSSSVEFSLDKPEDEWTLYKVSKMKFSKNKNKTDKSTIIFNDYLRIVKIPDKAYEYVVNGRSAIEWIMECYQIKTDKKSGIVNDPNDWCKENDNPKYILDLLLSIINVSVQTVDIVDSLPKLNFE